ncbi:MAG TPA: thrombospondin type 3 repeat-containing protein, partial [Polyangium sp.]|nr:thrombospondin type 3 repeat-containing protein [Polyangium sp.]
MAAIGTTASAGGIAEAQEAAPSIALERFYASNAGDRLFSVASPYVLGHKVPHVALYIDYAHDPLILREKTTKEYGASVVSNQMFLRANGTFTLKDRIQFNLDLPAALIQTGDEEPNKLNIKSPTGPDFGDIRLGVRVRIYGNNNSKFQLGVNGYLWFPTGTGNYVTDGWVRGLPQVVVGGRFPRVVYSAALGAEIRPKIDYLDGIPLGTTFVGSGGAGILLGKDKLIQVGPEFSVMTQLRDVTSQNLNIEALAGGKYRFRPMWEAGVAMGPGLSSGIGTPDFRMVVNVAYTPPWTEKDTDGDGIIDKEDACVYIKGIRHPNPKKHGCPSDRDEDYIIDIQDACPDVKGIPHPDPKKNGCPPDADEDGILDPVDACVTVKGIPHKDPRKHGCPSDRDDDGIIDAVDACPDVKGVPDKDPKKHGCPPDRDGDGVPDAEDACPDVPGIRTNDPKTNGCPGDSDGDGGRPHQRAELTD